MITTTEQYNANLHLINNINPPTFATLPSPDNIYNIDLKTREVNAPQFLAVEEDHASETIYFIVDRFFSYMDLSTTSCVITYNNAKGMSKQYAVPFYDIFTYANQKKMIIPWVLDSVLAEASGQIEFSICFFKVGEYIDELTNETKKIITYKLNTKPASSQILSSLKVGERADDSLESIEPNNFQILSEMIASIEGYNKTYWTILD